MFVFNINQAACVKQLWQVIVGQGVCPSLTIIPVPGVQAQRKISFQESFNETLHRTWMQADKGRLTPSASLL